MTAGTVVITGGILATVILLCIIAVLCYCRLQVLGGVGGWRGAQGGTLQRAGAPAQGEASKKVQGNQPCPASACEGSVVASQTPCEARLLRFREVRALADATQLPGGEQW